MRERSSTPATSKLPANGNNIGLSLEARFHAAMPRLRRLAMAHIRIADRCDDIIQETLLEAWRGIAHLQDSARFDAWLDGICRNICLRHLRAQHRQMQYETPLREDVADTNGSFGDLYEGLQLADLVVLLDRALGHLNQASRQVLDLCYGQNLSFDEVAMQLGLTRNALDVRLFRARRHLRAALNGPLRAEALAFGIQLDTEESAGWHESREWCMWCGTRRLRGTIMARPGFGNVLRMRCPVCSPRYNFDHVNTAGIVALDDVHSFRPALKRLHQAVTDLLPRYQAGLHCGGLAPCGCGRLVPIRICTCDDLGYAIPSTFGVALVCPQCGTNVMSLSNLWIAQPAIQQFKASHPRHIHEPAHLVTFDNYFAIQHTYHSLPDNERLVVFANADNGEVLAIVTDP